MTERNSMIGGETVPHVIADFSTTGTTSAVASAAADTAILPVNPVRRGAAVFNESTAILYLLLAATGVASSTNYTVALGPSDYYETPYGYTGRVQGRWAAASGFARVTEFT